MVDPPTPIKEQSSAGFDKRTVHVAFTPMADQGAFKNAAGLVRRASPSLLSTQGSTALEEQLHPDRLDAAGLSSLISTTKPEAIYIGSARSASASETLRTYLEELLTSSVSSSLKVVLVEPAAVRHFTSPQASSLYDLARTRSITLLLPVRWNSLWAASIQETLLGLEILHDLQAEEAEASVQATLNGDPDASVEKSFDVSMSNIPTGLSSDGLDKMAETETETETVKTQLEQLKRELDNRDKRIAELNRRVEEQQRQIQLQLEPKFAVAETVDSKSVSTKAKVVEPKTPVRSAVAAASQVGTPAAPVHRQSRTVSETPAGSAQTSGSAVQATAATESTTVSPPAATLPVPSTSQPLAAALSSPSTSTATTTVTTPTASLAPSASITSSPTSRSSNVIAALTSQLAETQALLDSTRTALSLARSQAATHQASADEMRSVVSRARLEADSSITILARKDRQISEALERARKAEAEAKELGRASREWGTRIREVEEELGKERMKRSRAEHAYELVGNEWKLARTRLIEQVQTLKEEHRKAVSGLAVEYQKVLVFKDRLQAESHLVDGESPSQLVTQLSKLNDQMQLWIVQQLHPLSNRLKQFEARENAQVMDKLSLLTDELTRIKTLMRRGDVVSSKDVPPGPF